MQLADDLVDYYLRELASLRADGADFARRHPAVAGRLCLSDGESPDPHTEQLIQSVAFLAARTQRAVDRESPILAAALLDHLAPSLSQPVPSISVAELALDDTQGKVTAGLRLPQHAMLQARSLTGPLVRLRTAWETRLWPVHVSAARLIDGLELHLQLRCTTGKFSDLELDRLSLHLRGDGLQTAALYEGLAGNVRGACVIDADGRRRTLPHFAWRDMGLDDDECLLPTATLGPAGFEVMQTCLASPQALMFFEARGLRDARVDSATLDLVLQLEQPISALRGLSAKSLATNCVPVVNLFVRTSEPLRFDGRRTEALLIADQADDASTEIHSIVSVTASDPDAEQALTVPAFGGLSPEDAAQPDATFWYARRDASLRPGIAGQDVYLSLVDRGMAPASPKVPVVHARLLCTNRGLAAQLLPGTLLRAEGLSAGLTARLLYTPSAQRPAPAAAVSPWRLIALLRLNQHGLLQQREDPRAAVQALRDMLGLIGGADARDLAPLRGLVGLQARPATVRASVAAWQGWVRGLDVELLIDRERFAGTSPLLLAAVIARMLALYATVNHFVRLTALDEYGPIRRWPAMTGRQVIA